MGLFDFLSSKPTTAKIEKAMKRMLNEHHQQQVRQESMEELLAYGTPLAIEALTRRFAMNFRDTIVNEQEKRWVADTLVEQFAERAVEPLVTFLHKEQNVSYAIRTLSRLVDADRLVDEMLKALKLYAPADHRTIQARLQFVDALNDHPHTQIIPALLPYLRDHDDDVRIKVTELLERKAKDAPEHLPDVGRALADVLTDAEASGRILRRVADSLIALDIDARDALPDLEKHLPDGYAVSPAGRLIRR